MRICPTTTISPSFLIVHGKLNYQMVFCGEEHARCRKGRVVVLDVEQLINHSLYRLLGHNDFLYSNLVLNENSNVLVLGGFEGKSALTIHRAYQSNVFVLEPVADFFFVLKEKIGEFDRIIPIMKGVTSDGRKIQLEVKGDATSTTDDSDRKTLFYVQAESIAIHDALAIAPSGFELVEINIEGMEYEILEAMFAQQSILPRTILIQFHNINPDSTDKYNLCRAFLEQEYICIYSFKFVWERWERKDFFAQDNPNLQTIKRQYENLDAFYRKTWNLLA